MSLSVVNMEDELKSIRITFIKYLLFPVIALPVIIFLAVALGSFVHIVLGLSIGFLGLCGYVICDGLLFEKVILSRCPNCGHKFYSFWRWPFVGVIYFFYFNNCSHCKLNGFGKNIEHYTK